MRARMTCVLCRTTGEYCIPKSIGCCLDCADGLAHAELEQLLQLARTAPGPAMTDNLPRLTTAPDLSLVTVDGLITETNGRYPRQLVLTDDSGSIDITVYSGCVGGPAVNDTPNLVGTYAVVAGRREDASSVLAAVVRLAERTATRDLLIPATLSDLSDLSDLSEHVVQLLSRDARDPRRQRTERQCRPSPPLDLGRRQAPLGGRPLPPGRHHRRRQAER